MSVSVNPSAGQPEICSVNVQVQSSLQIIVGFTTDVASDYPYLDPIADSVTNRIITYIHSADNEHRTPILTHSLLYDAYNATSLQCWQAYASTCRSCSFHVGHETKSYNCPNRFRIDANEFHIAHIGEDEFGNMFQRVTLAHCNQAGRYCSFSTVILLKYKISVGSCTFSGAE
ncbi:hypothetical protein COOONC_24080 [Cooperia oncophora]